MDEARPRVIAIEEHYLDPEVDAALGGQGGGDPRVRDQLFDLGELRLRDMDAAGIDVQVLSHCPPGGSLWPPMVSHWAPVHPFHPTLSPFGGICQ